MCVYGGYCVERVLCFLEFEMEDDRHALCVCII